VSGPAVTAPSDLPGAVLVAGRGATLYPDLFAPPAGPLDVDAAAVAELAVRGLSSGGANLLPAEPLYLRRPDAAPPGARKRVLT
jgi:hypothetical protein